MLGKKLLVLIKKRIDKRISQDQADYMDGYLVWMETSQKSKVKLV